MDIEKLAGSKLGNYEIESLLGRGGMGVVYKARQISLNRPVALKILPPTLSSDASFVKRFQREAQAVAQLDHPNIVQIIDISKAKGLHFFSMQYIKGRTLDEVLKEKGCLDAYEAVRIITQAAQGIEHAHNNDIIHRDIKPSNIILDESGNAKVMDFGLARSTEERSKLTRSGTLMGTLDYMSPEQCRGVELDERTDIYSLGVVLFETLTGRAPFEAPNEAALINKIINEDPPDIQTLNPNVPISLSKIIFKATAKDREDRYSDIGDLLEDLRSCAEALKPGKATIPLDMDVHPASNRGRRVAVAAVAAMLVCLCIAGIVFLLPSEIKESKETEPGTAATRPLSEEKVYSSIVVLPFVNMSADSDQEYFCDGLAETLINELTRIRDLRVIARTSAFSFKGRNLDVREIGSKLNVEAVLEGSVQRAGDRLRITAQLVDTAGGHHLWSEKYDRTIDDIFEIQDDISRAIVDKLRLKLSPAEKAGLEKGTAASIEAYDLCLRGFYFRNKFTPQAIEKAFDYFRLAIDKDPNCALAYSGVAECYSILHFFGEIRPSEAVLKAREFALKALELDETLAEAHEQLAWAKLVYDWDWDGAEKGFKRAMELNPGFANTRHTYATFLSWLGRFDDAVQESEIALDSDPLSPEAHVDHARVLLNCRRYERAITHLQTAIEMFPDRPFLHSFLGEAYREQSAYEKALEEFKKEKEISGEWNVLTDFAIGTTYSLMGEEDKARQILKNLMKQSQEKYVPPSLISYLYRCLGDSDKAFEWIEKAYQEHDYFLCYMKIDTLAEKLGWSSDPRHIEMLKKIGLDT